MAFVFAYDWNGDKTTTNVDENDVKSIHVLILSGDEILDITTKSGVEIHVDAGQGTRVTDYYDGQYDVDEDYVPEWMRRKDSYDY